MKLYSLFLIMNTVFLNQFVFSQIKINIEDAPFKELSIFNINNNTQLPSTSIKSDSVKFVLPKIPIDTYDIKKVGIYLYHNKEKNINEYKYINLWVGVDSSKKIYVSIDMDEDFNFSNNLIVRFKSIDSIEAKDISTYRKEIHFIKIKKEGKNFYLSVFPVCYSTIFKSSPHKLTKGILANVRLDLIQLKKIKKVNKKSKDLFIQNLSHSINNYRKEDLVFYSKNENLIPLKYRYSDTIPSAIGNIKINFISKNGLYISLFKVDENKVINGINVGKVANYFSKKDIYDSIITLPKLISSQYTLLDFWYLKCIGCVKSLPLLKELSMRPIKIVGITFENTTLVKDYCKKNNLLFSQIADNTIGANSIIMKYKISTYPTFILINKSGIIIFREYGFEGLKKIVAFLDNKKL